jgi:hypothetical protein
MGFLSSKKEPVKQDSAAEGFAPTDVGGGEAAQLQALTARLGELGAAVDDATREVMAYLMQRETQPGAGAAGDGPAGAIGEKLDLLVRKLDALMTGAAPRESAAPAAAAPALGEESLRSAVRPLLDRLDQIEGRLKSLPAPAPVANVVEALGPALTQVRGGLIEQKEAVTAAIRQLAQRMDDGMAQLADYVRPKEPDESAVAPVSNVEWQRAVLGREIAEHPALAFQRQQLLDGVVEGNPGACSLAGQLLVFQSAPAEKMPQLLKEIGEAYYRWQPKTKAGANKMEEVLVDWLGKACDEAGIANTIELVHPGERFDSTRHTAGERGVEITEVYGWIVLRDNGKVYTKASVAVK